MRTLLLDDEFEDERFYVVTAVVASVDPGVDVLMTRAGDTFNTANVKNELPADPAAGDERYPVHTRAGTTRLIHSRSAAVRHRAGRLTPGPGNGHAHVKCVKLA